MIGKHRNYRSIFLTDGWAHHKYFGWQVVADEPGLRVLSKRHGIFRRYLMLLTAGGELALKVWVTKTVGMIGLSDIIIHDFSGIFDRSPRVNRCLFRPVRQDERLLNIATFVIDLKDSEESLFGAMSSDYRRKIRKAEKVGLNVKAYKKPSLQLLNDFYTAFSTFAIERGLNLIDSSTLALMYHNGDAVLFVANNNDEVTNYLHVYKADDKASFMYGVNISKKNDGAGQYLHWQVMLWLKEQGLSWYDLGGVASCDPSDGIYNFKQKFGGRFVALGAEWRCSGAAVVAGVQAKKMVRLIGGVDV